MALGLAVSGCWLAGRLISARVSSSASCWLSRPVLSVIERFLVDVAVDLFAVDPGLAVVEDRGQALIWCGVLAALFVVAELLEVDASLVAVAGELLAVADGLLELGEALFFGELA